MRNRTQDDYYAESRRLRSAYFAYFSRELGCKTILCMRKMKDGVVFKPYAIIDQYTFEARVSELQKETPL